MNSIAKLSMTAVLLLVGGAVLSACTVKTEPVRAREPVVVRERPVHEEVIVR